MTKTKKDIFYKVLRKKIDKYFKKNPYSKKVIIKAKLQNEDIFWEALKVNNKKYHINEVKSSRNNFSFLLEYEPEKTSATGQAFGIRGQNITPTSLGLADPKAKRQVDSNTQLMFQWNPYSPMPDTKFNQLLKKNGGDINKALEAVPSKVFRTLMDTHKISSFRQLKNDSEKYQKVLEDMAAANPHITKYTGVKPRPGTKVDPNRSSTRPHGPARKPDISNDVTQATGDTNSDPSAKTSSVGKPMGIDMGGFKKFDLPNNKKREWDIKNKNPNTELNKLLRKEKYLHKAIRKMPIDVFQYIFREYGVSDKKQLLNNLGLYGKVVADFAKINPNIEEPAADPWRKDKK